MVPVAKWICDVIIKPVGAHLVRNAPRYLTTIGIAGVAGTAIMAAKAAPKAKEAVDELDFEDPDDKVEVFVTKFKVAAPYFAGTVGMGVLTVSSFLAGQRILSKRQAAAAIAATIAENALKDYQDELLQKVSPKKISDIRDGVAKKKLDSAPSLDEAVIENTGYGSTLCYDAVTGRYFRSDIEKIRQAENTIVKWCADETEVDLNAFYEELGLRPCKCGKRLIWRIDGIRPDIHFSSHVKDGQPVLVLDYQFEVRRY